MNNENIFEKIDFKLIEINIVHRKLLCKNIG